ncbi:MAG TPA: toxin TcdB middle/C-terminal domain-containing protein, partial [Polyangiaceae bacterium]|nr:toxin TcdB middle/C-terminal domain-containing protein [Polyangiaceae bacterium]
DDTPLAEKPYAVTEQNFSVRRLQAALNGKHGVFFVHPRESLAVHTERHAEDPRVAHELTLRVDDFGNVTRLAKIAYARQPVAARRPEQSKTLATLTLSSFVNHPGALDPDNTAPAEHWHRLGVGFDASTYELTGLPAPADLEGVLEFDTVDELVENLLSNLGPANDLPFEDTSPATTSLRRRVLDRKQQSFYDSSLSAALPLGQITSLALPYESYTLALTPGLVAQIVADSLALSGTAFDLALLLSEGGYASREGGYWAPSGRLLFDPTRFYLPVEAVDPFGNHAFVTWDAFSLLVTSTRDSLNNVVSADNDYRVLGPRLVTDANLNRIEASFDALGMLVRTAVMGKAGETKGDTIQTPTSELQYDLFRWMNEGEPARVHTILREEHSSDNPASRLQHSYAYSDGFGRVVMQKVQAEPGEVPGMSGVINPRWVGTGRTIFNNKGNPVKQYEPFFSPTSDYESEDVVVQFGVTPILHYDPLGRVIRTDYPDGTFSKVLFDAWREENWDQNDTVLESRWYQDRGAPSPTGPEPTDPTTRSAWLAAQHAGTPTVTHLDTLGRVFSSISTNRTSGVTAEYQTKTQLDIEGNTLAIFDARQIDLNPLNPLPTITQAFDVLQRRLKLVSADAGTRLGVADAAGKPLRAWDSRGQTLRSRYDALQRATHAYVRKGALERLLIRTVYGEALDPTLAQQNNLRGKAYQVYDCAGLVTSGAYDFKGNLLSASRRLAVAYTTEPDWIAAQALNDPAAILGAVGSLLQTETFTTTSTFDALNRVTRSTAPDGAASATRFVYNEASLLESMHVAVRGAAEAPVVGNIDYNARGQRVRCDYQNGSVTTYQHDPKTFRVSQIRTLRTSDG